jgi:hypothetical protein
VYQGHLAVVHDHPSGGSERLHTRPR